VQVRVNGSMPQKYYARCLKFGGVATPRCRYGRIGKKDWGERLPAVAMLREWFGPRSPGTPPMLRPVRAGAGREEETVGNNRRTFFWPLVFSQTSVMLMKRS